MLHITPKLITSIILEITEANSLITTKNNSLLFRIKLKTWLLCSLFAENISFEATHPVVTITIKNHFYLGDALTNLRMCRSQISANI